VDGLSQPIGQRQLSVLAAPVVPDVLGDERTQSQTLLQLKDQEQTTIGSNARTLEINFKRRVKRELEWLILFLTYWVEPPRSSFYSQSRMNTGVGAIKQPLTQSSKRKCGLKMKRGQNSVRALRDQRHCDKENENDNRSAAGSA